MRVSNVYTAANLKTLYNGMGKDGSKKDLQTYISEAASKNKNITMIKDKLSISKRSAEFGSDEWLDQILEDVKKQDEQNEINAIMSKLYSGEELSAAEMEVLQEKAPELYKMALEARQQKKDLERKLRNAKSKNEVERIKLNAMQSIAYQSGTTSGASKAESNVRSTGGDGAKEMRIRILFAAIDKTVKEFYKSDEYNKLPEKTEEEKRKEEETGFISFM